MSIEDEQVRQELLKSLGLNEEGCEIRFEDSFYIIRPKIRSGQLYIASITSADVFNQHNLEFKNCVFDSLKLTRETINKEIRFQRCTFKKCTLDRCVFKKFVNFNFGNLNSSFSNFVCTDTIFEDIAYFIKLTFEGNVDFSRSRFKERAFFSESTFNNKADFAEVIFDNNAYFDEAKFLKEANFKQSEFYKNAHFYKTSFKEIPEKNITIEDIPCFLQVIFNGSINLTGTKLFDFDFEQFKSIINTSDDKAKTAEEFRNIFKYIKNALIKDNNLLDASRFHKMELYAKELELKYAREDKVKNLGIRDIVDRVQLMLYRLTSDHHTDLLLILNNVIIIIALFSIMSFTINHFDMHSLEIGQFVGAFFVCLIFIILASFLILGYKELNFSYITISYIQTSFYENKNSKKCFRVCIVFFSHITTIITLVVKPTSLIPLFGKLVDGCFGISSSISISLSIIYTIFIFLLIWSLQKTARKNTVVPK